MELSITLQTFQTYIVKGVNLCLNILPEGDIKIKVLMIVKEYFEFYQAVVENKNWEDVGIDLVNIKHICVTNDVVMYDGKNLLLGGYDFVWYHIGSEGTSHTKHIHYMIAKLCSRYKIKMVNSLQSKYDAMDKIKCTDILLKKGFPIPASEKIYNLPPCIKPPYFLKKSISTGGKDVIFISSNEQFYSWLSSQPYSRKNNWMAQKPILSSLGKSMRITCCATNAGEYTCIASKIVNKKDLRSNRALGGKCTVINDPPYAATSIAENAMRVLNLSFAGIDLLFGRDNTFFIIEVNTACGMITEISAQNQIIKAVRKMLAFLSL